MLRIAAPLALLIVPLCAAIVLLGPLRTKERETVLKAYAVFAILVTSKAKLRSAAALQRPSAETGGTPLGDGRSGAVGRRSMSFDGRVRLAEEVRAALLRAALEAYEQAGISGLCHEGRWEIAAQTIRELDLRELLERIEWEEV